MINETVQITPLDQEKRSALPTREAAIHLNRAEQTLLFWASRSSKGCGPIKPIRVGRQLAWPVSEIKKLLGVTE